MFFALCFVIYTLFFTEQFFSNAAPCDVMDITPTVCCDPATMEISPNGRTCRQVRNDCDVRDSCDGISSNCDDKKEPDGKQCAGGTCQSGVCTPPPPTNEPTEFPTKTPTKTPTLTPTKKPTGAPTAVPTIAPTSVPTAVPTAVPTVSPTQVPTQAPTLVGVQTSSPTPFPSPSSVVAETRAPTTAPVDNRPFVTATNQVVGAPDAAAAGLESFLPWIVSGALACLLVLVLLIVVVSKLRSSRDIRRSSTGESNKKRGGLSNATSLRSRGSSLSRTAVVDGTAGAPRSNRSRRPSRSSKRHSTSHKELASAAAAGYGNVSQYSTVQERGDGDETAGPFNLYRPMTLKPVRQPVGYEMGTMYASSQYLSPPSDTASAVGDGPGYRPMPANPGQQQRPIVSQYPVFANQYSDIHDDYATTNSVNNNYQQPSTQASVPAYYAPSFGGKLLHTYGGGGPASPQPPSYQ